MTVWLIGLWICKVVGQRVLCDVTNPKHFHRISLNEKNDAVRDAVADREIELPNVAAYPCGLKSFRTTLRHVLERLHFYKDLLVPLASLIGRAIVSPPFIVLLDVEIGLGRNDDLKH